MIEGSHSRRLIRLGVALATVASLSLGPSSSAAPTAINFGPDFDPPDAQVILTDQLAEFGVVFASPVPTNNVWWVGFNGQGSFPYEFRTEYGQGGFLTLDLLAFDDDDQLIAQSSYGPGPGDFFPPQIVTVTEPEISYVVLETSNTQSGLFFNRITFELTPIPEPGTATLLGVGLIALARRRRSHGTAGTLETPPGSAWSRSRVGMRTRPPG